ncbi:MAG TPA: DUF72 domain-containing protein [Sphingomonas sp.]|uniref:DUF72 domain-containing protein n=1 Tax=Sphingomonas sp. TaxID=28214 RepID=UPI002B50D49D|nr:DUF72 domain-containing protein [Sphingomonas sp.]HMI20436.1 DUF72 domain-containing protein [Sphingomonas sp.]
MIVRIGTAGWSIPAAFAAHFPTQGTNLERYAACFSAVEINSSFYRPHRPATYARWAASVGPDFRFAVKLPKAITHERRLVDIDDPLDRFVAEIAALGPKLGPVLVQLPPSLAFSAPIAETFFVRVRDRLAGSLACEPRHPSWFSAEADALLVHHRIARVAADPAPVPKAAEPGGWSGLAYFRLHGAPRIYWSEYGPGAVVAHAATVKARTAASEVWTIYDNTASGAATRDAVRLRAFF